MLTCLVGQESTRAHKKIKSHCKKSLAISPSPAGMSLTKLSLSLAGKNLIIPDQGEFGSVTSRLGTGKWLTFFTVQSQY